MYEQGDIDPLKPYASVALYFSLLSRIESSWNDIVQKNLQQLGPADSPKGF